MKLGDAVQLVVCLAALGAALGFVLGYRRDDQAGSVSLRMALMIGFFVLGAVRLAYGNGLLR